MILIAVVAGYLIGTIPFALLISNQWGVDLRRTGSGNLGAANVMRASGVRSGVLVAALDMAKGAASVWLAERLTSNPAAPAAAGAIVGAAIPLTAALSEGWQYPVLAIAAIAVLGFRRGVVQTLLLAGCAGALAVLLGAPIPS